MTATFEALAVGLLFGFLLQKAGLARYDRIVNVYRFRDLTVLKFLLTAVVTGAVAIRLLVSTGAAGSVPVPATFVLGNAAGGFVFGIGMALSGFCPGTIAAGVGEGRLDYLFPGVLGMIAGALGFGIAYQWLMPVLRIGAVGALALPEWVGAEPWLVVLLFVELFALAVYALERPSRGADSAVKSP